MPLPMIPGGYTAPSAPKVPDQIAKVEAASGGTLPSSMTLALAQSTLEERRLLRAARMLASYFDLDPSWFLDPYRQSPGWVPLDGFADPVTGDRISLASARRFLRPHEPEVISRMLSEISGAEPELIKTATGLRPVPGTEVPNAGGIAHMVRALAPLAGERTPFAAALSFAMQAAEEHVNPDLLETNLSITARLRGLEPLLAAEIAKRATVAGVTFRGPGDVAAFVAPGAAPAIKEGEQYPTPAELAAKQKAVVAALAAGKPVPATPEEMTMLTAIGKTGGKIPIEAAFGQEIVAGLTMPGDFFKSLTESQNNYIAAAKDIEARVKIPFTDSWLGHAVGNILDYAWRPFDAIGRIIIHPSVLLAPFDYDVSNRPGRTNLDDAVLDAWDILNGRTTAAEELQAVGVPPWLTMTAELAYGFWLDPVQLGFNALSKARAARATFGLAETGRASERAAMVEDFLHSPVARLGRARGKTIEQYLLGEADLAEDAERFYGRAVRSFRARYMTEGINPLVAERIWRFAKASRKLKLTEAQRLEGIDSVFMHALGVTPKPGSLAADIATHVEALKVRTARQLPLLLDDGTRYIAPTERLTKDAEAALAALRDAEGDFARGRYRMVEIPHLGSPVTRAEIALATSRLADTGFGKTLRATFQMLPKTKGARYEINLETGTEAVRDFERGLRGYENLSTTELAQARLQFSRALESSNPFREQLAAKIVQNWQHKALARINARYGLDEEMSERIIGELETRLGGGQPEKTFAAFREGSTESVERLPILSRTQQANWLTMIDPYVYRQGIAETIGTWRKWRAAHYAAFGRMAPEARPVVIPVRKFLDQTMDLVTRDLFLSWFKPLVVRRGSYVLRVPAGEEQLRFLATLGFSRRVAAGKLLSGERAIEASQAIERGVTGARIAAKGIRPGEVEDALRFMVSRDPDRASVLNAVGFNKQDTTLGHSLARSLEETGSLTAEQSAQALAMLGKYRTQLAALGTAEAGPLRRLAGRMGRALEERGRVTVDTPGGPIHYLRASDLADDPLFNTATSHYSAATAAGRTVQDALSPNRWGAIARDDPAFIEWWYNALGHQFGLDPLGRRYLDDIAHGLDEEASLRRNVQWLTSPGDGMTEAKALMGGPYTRESLEIQVRKGVTYAYDLTSGHPDLAAAARAQTLTPEILRAVPEAERPLVVHGPLVAETVLSKATAPAKRFVRWYGRWIMEEPTNRLTRQPFGKSWYDRVYRSLVETARESGIVLTPKMLEGFKSTSREFAVTQVQRIMFDFTRQGRLDQLTRHVLIFVQPALEMPVAWARVIRQNPAVVWHVVRMARAATASGFMQTDPESGELMIPLSWWAGAAPLLAAAGIGRMGEGAGGGWSLSAPLTSFNFFAQNTFQLPTGRIAGEVPIPWPGWNPEALWGVQKLLEATPLRADVKARFASWLFAYGAVDPSTPGSMLPAYLHHTLRAIFPQWFESEMNLQTTNFMQLQQAMGLEPDIEKATWQAREFAGLRAFFAFVFPAAPRINFPTQDLEDEFQALVEKTGDYSKAREQFVGTWNPDTGRYEGGLHTGLDLITLGRTMWAEDNKSPQRITSSAAVTELLNGKGAKQFAQDHPLWVWAIIPSELREGEKGGFDFGAFFSQIASGQVLALTPSQYETKAHVQRGWDAYFALREGHLAWQEAHPTLGEGDPPYEEEALDYAAALAHVKETNPEWAQQFNTFELQGVDPKIMAESRRLANDKLFSQTDAGAGLAAYFELRDPIETELAKLGIHSINTIAAENAGLTKRYNAGVKEITEAHPDFATAYRLFFEGDLQHVLTTGEKALNRLPGGIFENEITPWWTRYEELRAAPNMAQLEGPRSQAYTDLRTYMNRAYSEFSKAENPLILQWNLKDPNYQATSLLSLISRPYAYLSMFDKTFLLGDATNRSTEKLWTAYADIRGAIADREATDPEFSSSKAYEGLEAWMRVQASRNKTFAAQVLAASTWGYSLSKVIEDPKLAQAMFGTDLGSESRSYWGAFLDGLGQIQHVVDASKLGGSYDPRAKVAYNALRGKLVEYVNALRDSSPQFKAQWDYLEEASGPDPAISYFMPAFGDYYGPLTGYPGE